MSDATPAVALVTDGLCKSFGGIHATQDVTLRVAAGARHALIGPNGAGKTTLVNLLTGMLEPSAGRIVLEGEDITRLPPHRRVRRGLVRTFQINQLFGDLTPLETLAMVIAERDGLGGRPWRALGRRREQVEEAGALAERFHLADVVDAKTGVLPYGKRRLLEIGLAVALKPSVLLLDEPAAGVPASERKDILDTVAALPADVSVLLIEHDMDLVFSFARHITVLVNGAVLTEGAPEAIAADPQVRAVYLGDSQIAGAGHG